MSRSTPPTTSSRSTASGSTTPRRASSRSSRTPASVAAPINYRLRDWLFSRQRYWGEPFPDHVRRRRRGVCRPRRPAAADPPRRAGLLPKTFDPGRRDRARPSRRCRGCPEWVNVELDLGDGRGRRHFRRETNTMPNWAGSCWYYLRYLDPANHEAFVDPANESVLARPRTPSPSPARPAGTRDPGGVDLYIGGVEHAVLHLLYARFWHKVLLRPRPRLERGAVPQVLLAGLHPGLRLHRQPRAVRPGGRGRGAPGRARRGADLHVAGPAGQPRVRQDRQVAEELRQPRRDVRRVRRRHLPRLRDVDGAARAEQAVGDPRGRRSASASSSGCGATSSTRRPGERAGRPTTRPTRR